MTHHISSDESKLDMIDRFIYTANDVLRLVKYQECDDRALYENWLDPDTQSGYNCAFNETFEEFTKGETKQRFFAMIQLIETNEIIGSVGISPPETIADLAIWIFKPFRKQGFGTSAFKLATEYAVNVLGINDLHTGAYPDNIGSIKMLKRCGFVPYPAGNVSEKHYITGEDFVQLDYIYKSISIRLAVPSDALDMAEVHMRSWEAVYKDIIPAEYIREKNATRPALWQRIITDENTIHYVIQLDKKTIGIMTVVPTPQDNDADNNTCELEGIYLHPDYYRMGIGAKALEFAFCKANEWGKCFMTLWVFADNISSIRFYEKCGFIPDRNTKILNCGKPLTAIRMRKSLKKTAPAL